MVVRTITTGSKRFTCTTTFGPRIVAACDDGTLAIYDSVTGALRLSLSLADPVRAMGGTPDGSLLFCAHNAPSITAWDMQTGGLIHTFLLKQTTEDIAVSMKGRYLACGLSGESVEVWEVANKMEGAAVWTRTGTHFCWLEPEGRLAVSTKGLVRVWDIIAGSILRSFKIPRPVNRMVYSEKFNRLAIMTGSTPGDAITIIDLQTGTSTRVSPPSDRHFSCFAFSQTAKDLVCGVNTGDCRLWSWNLSEENWRSPIEYPDTVTSVSSLPNGTIVAEVAGSGIKLLNLDQPSAPSPNQKMTIPAPTMRAFDHGKIIAVLGTSGNFHQLMEVFGMSILLTHNAWKARATAVDGIYVLCASLQNSVAICCFEERNREYMQLWRLLDEELEWTVEVGTLPSIGEISQWGDLLATLYDVDNQTCICVWNLRNGQLKAELRTDPIRLLDITFDSHNRFFIHHDNYRVPYTVTATESATFGHLITRRKALPLARGLRKERYHLDDTYEWVINESKQRVCWIPPGYIGSVKTEPSYCWAGNSLVMVGEDGMLRRLTFRAPN